MGGRTYYLRVYAHSLKSYESSDEIKFPVPARVKHKAITAGVVGGILFFIVAIILSVCVVKICNKKKRRKQEKGKLPPSRGAKKRDTNASLTNYSHCCCVQHGSVQKLRPEEWGSSSWPSAFKKVSC